MEFDKLTQKLTERGLNILVYHPEGVLSSGLEISRIVSDSRRAGADSIFACVKGDSSDGHDYAARAVESGARALMCEHEMNIPVPQIICKDIRRNMGIAAAELYGNPSSDMMMAAVTGTNGKTTTTFMIKSILEYSGIKTGLLGTIYYDDGNVSLEADHTTPEGADLGSWLFRMKKNSCRACVMEASSHALDQGRIDGVLYDRAVFTNLSVDHLDYHGDMESYFQAKRLLFEKYMKDEWKASFNIDDEYGMRLFKEFRNNSLSFGMKNESADFFAKIKQTTVNGIDAAIKTPCSEKMFDAHFPLLGEYNILNALAAISVAWSFGIPSDTAISGLVKMKQVPGRLERYLIGNGTEDCGSCVIDFAHSPDSLEKVITALRPLCKGRLVVVFGAGGDRDRTKRPLMGEIATRLADMAIITSDNPRSEDPAFITSEIEAGAKKHTTDFRVILDRRTAIYEGLNMIEKDDIILIAGRGHERYQVLKDGPIPMLDKDVLIDWSRAQGKEVYS